MVGKRAGLVLALALFTSLAGYLLTAGESPNPAARRAKLQKLYNDGNFKEAYNGLRPLALDAKNDPLMVGKDLELGIQCLQRLGRVDEIDEFREGVITVHKDNWRLLATAAKTYIQGEHHGYIVAGKFYRGQKRGGARYVNVFLRDRTRAMQLMDQALPLTTNDADKHAVADYYFQFANLLLLNGGEAWRLQDLTDLAKLPDHEEGYPSYGGGNPGAPVDAQGNPVYHFMPKSYEDAETDGQRWRWMLAEVVKHNPARLNEIDFHFAGFLRGQFDVQTMAYGYYGPPRKEQTTGTYALHTLKEIETIARLATGLKRFEVPDEFNWIKIYERIAGRAKSKFGEQSLDTLAHIFEDRRQYPRAAGVWKNAIADYGAGDNNFRSIRLEQIVGNWARFEPIRSQGSSTKATVDLRFRNGNKVFFEATAIRVEKLLADVKAYLASNPGRLDWNNVNIGDIGHRLVVENQQQYLGEKVAVWNMDLKPRPNHVDDRVTVTTPMTKPGAYLVTAQMAGGNVSRIIVWLNDTVIAKKQLDGEVYHFVADANSGQPVPQANVEFFGWRQIQVQPNKNQFQVLTKSFVEKTDQDGQLFSGADKLLQDYQWLITAKKARGKGEDDRLAYLGFTGIWFGRQYDQEYNRTRTLIITDRPVYRPEQMVQFKAWVRHAKYDQQDTSSFAGQSFLVRIFNPKREKVLEKTLVADEYGGLQGEVFLSKLATLGVYQVTIDKHGSNTFRVEEYKKPEYEVKVEAPKEPVRLGEKVTATIEAKYYFGAPVTRAKVKYKVTRTVHSNQWYPVGRWDWFYGPGYWWFAADYPWYPGWQEWGCMRPYPWWFGERHTPPEIIMENEVPVGPDGTVQVVIDTTAAKELHGDQDHQYTITAEVVDESRRSVVGTGNVIVSREPFQVYAWVDRGHYRAGDTIKASFNAQTVDRKPVKGSGIVSLFEISYDDKNQPIEKRVQSWVLDTNVEGRAEQQMKAAKAGQYRLSYKVTDSKNHTIEGGYVFVVRGEGFTGRDYRFNDIELITDKREYQPGEKIKLLVNTNKDDGVVLLFARPTNGVYLRPRVIRLQGKSTEEDIAVVQRDMPNMFIEAMTIADGRVHTEVREIVVPPEKRVLNVEVVADQTEYKPGQKASVKVKLTDITGEPFVGSTVVTVYDKSVEYISGGSNVPEIKSFFWKWRRHHHPQTMTSLDHYFHNLLRRNETGMSNLGVFGKGVVEEFGANRMEKEAKNALADPQATAASPPTPVLFPAANADAKSEMQQGRANAGPAGPAGAAPPALVQPAVRRNFADTAFWAAALTTNAKGEADIAFTVPDNLTTWKVKVWAMGHGTKVGQGEVELIAKKDLIVRLQAPRFFVQKDEAVLSANVHNYLKKEKLVDVVLELEGGTLVCQESLTQKVRIPAGGEQRVDWRVKVINEGDAIVRMKALTDEDSDAMEMRFPCYVHGMLKMESFTGVIRPEKDDAKVAFSVPAERRINETVLEVRYSPTLAGALVDALPYLVDYPYGCTEQTLNRFLPTVITQRILQKMNLDLKEIEKHQTNLNSQEIGDDRKRMTGWKRYKRNPVFDEAEVKQMTAAGIQALASMQLGDGGWGWFSGFGERSYPHTTAVVVHGLQIAQTNDISLPANMLQRGIAWLKSYQAEQVRMLQNAPTKVWPWKEHADNTDALVYLVLVDANEQSKDMMDFLYRDRTHLSVYGKSLLGLGLYKQQQADMLAMVLRNIEQFLVQDEENHTAYLRMPESNSWWYWYGSEIEAHAFYLKLLSHTHPKEEKTARLVKYLLNNRKHSTYWNSTRDTAYCIEAMADFIKNSGEDQPDMTVEIWLDGQKKKDVKIDQKNLFRFDNKLVMVGDSVTDGKHTLEIKRQGKGPVYFNAYLTNFTFEDFITKAGLEVKVERKYYKLTRVDHAIKVPGSKGQSLGHKVEKYTRTELPNLASLKSGDLVEIELEIDSKNDYEYLIFEDPKAAGFEPLLVRSGYTNTGLGAYMELRDEKVAFFVRALPRGKHSISYRMRAEIPGRFSALPTRAYAMYAPELKGNSDEIKLIIQD